MKAVRILDAAYAAGVHIEVDKGDLVLEADSAPPDEIVDALFSAKAAIIALLATQNGDSKTGNCVSLFPEQGSTQFGKNRHLPDTLDDDAYQRAINTWLNNHPVVSQPDRCARCFRRERPDHAVIPFGIYTRGHVWLHGECWDPWQQHRRQMATRALENENIHCHTAFAPTEELRGPKAVIDDEEDDNWTKGDDKL